MFGKKNQWMGLFLVAASLTPVYGAGAGAGGAGVGGEAKVVEGFQPYELDTSHTVVRFDISHLVISTVEGRFNKFIGTFDYDAAKQTIQNAKISIDVASIDTNEPKRDDHLRGPDFFDAQKYPKITFDTAKLVGKDGKPVQLIGMLEMHGVKKEVTLHVDFKGAMTDPGGSQKIVFNLSGKINRLDYGLTWNKTLDKGGVAIGEEVNFDIKVEATQKK